MTNDECSEAAAPRVFDLEERTAVFGESVIDFAATIKLTPIVRPIVSQLIDAATSIGANYCEADDAESKKDFRHKIGICRKESRESMYWFRMIARAAPYAKEAGTPTVAGSSGAESDLLEDSPLLRLESALIRLFVIRHSSFVISSCSSTE